MVQTPISEMSNQEAWRVHSVQSQTSCSWDPVSSLMMPKHPASQILCFLLSCSCLFTYSTHFSIHIMGFGSLWQDGLVSAKCQGPAPPIWGLYT